MISAVDNYMKNKGFVKDTGISIATVDDPAQVLTESQPRSFKYVVDDDKQTIQGFHIEDPHLFWVVEAAVHNSVMAGWQPTKDDIMDTYRVITTPQPELERDFKRIFGDAHDGK